MVAGRFDTLKGLKVLVVEDEYLIAMSLSDELEACGALVLGPASSVENALAAIEDDAPDVAMLDVELQGKLMTPVAEALTQRDIPYILTTGHDSAAVPLAYQTVPRCMKPAPASQVLDLLCTIVKPR